MLSRGEIFCCLVAGALLARAAEARNFDLLGSATLLPDGEVQITSDVHDPEQGHGAMALLIPPALRLRDLKYLGGVVDLTDDGAGADSPRFIIALDTNRSGHFEASDAVISVLIGRPPNFDDQPGGPVDTGNLLVLDTPRWDTRALPGGRRGDTLRHTLQLASTLLVLRVAVVVDGGFIQPDNEQTVVFSSIRLNSWVYAGSPDEDGDGILDPQDTCPGSDLRSHVDVNGDAPGVTSVENFVDSSGCSVQDYVNKAALVSRTHKRYVTQINNLSSRLYRRRQISRAQVTEMRSGAAASRIGYPAV